MEPRQPPDRPLVALVNQLAFPSLPRCGGAAYCIVLRRWPRRLRAVPGELHLQLMACAKSFEKITVEFHTELCSTVRLVQSRELFVSSKTRSLVCRSLRVLRDPQVKAGPAEQELDLCGASLYNSDRAYGSDNLLLISLLTR